MCDDRLCLSVFRMDSFFLAEMFKYLYLMFSEKSQLPIDIDDYIFTTEAHLLPISLSTTQPACQGNNTVRGLHFVTNTSTDVILLFFFFLYKLYILCFLLQGYCILSLV